jgi:hypothetical protein
MTIEKARLVRLPVDVLEIRSLLGDIRAARARADKANPGDRVDVIRYEALSSQLERVARHQVAVGEAQVVEVDGVDRPGDCFYDAANFDLLPAGSTAAGWVSEGDIAVEIRTPLSPGETQRPSEAAAPLAGPATPWNAPMGDDGEQLEGTAAVAVRFSEQVQDAIDGKPNSALVPSGVSNRVLTEALRHFAADDSTSQRDVPVVYRDGSTARSFPLRCLRFADKPPASLRTYRFALLSIRHTEMDVEVDGAWLRNTDISRPRPHADTDQLAYELTQQQLDALCKRPVLFYLYQTGLDPAVVGFYRAIAERLLDDQQSGRTGSVSVVPMYFQRQPPGGQNTRRVAGYEAQSLFAEGTAWCI